jgi:Flp pilus assembly protein TadD
MAEATVEGFDVNQRRDFQRHRAAALDASGRSDEALVVLTELARQHPQHRAVQEELGQLLLSRSDAPTLRQALDQWRRIAARCRPRTTAWFRAKYNVALAQYKLGDKDSASRLIRYLQLTEDLSSSGLSEEFLDLRQRCE